MFAGGRYRLFVQHRADAPAFEATGWGRFSSDDLLSWSWDGPVLPATATDWAYSGSVTVHGGGALEAHHTLHACAPGAEPRERQACAVSTDAGRTWATADAVMAPAGRNVRDPFVFAWEGEWRMLLARPCDWTNWSEDPPSELGVLASPDRRTWASVGTVGPWAPPGVMWEVPVLARFGDVWALIVSVVDRRAGEADCGVRYWLGAFDGAGFTPRAGAPAQGLPLDLGPDFYAAVLNTEAGWPTRDRLVTAWASNWRTARRIPWLGGMAGGPITQPRIVELAPEADRLRQRPMPAAMVHARTVEAQHPGVLRIETGAAEIIVVAESAGVTVSVSRGGRPELAWTCSHQLTRRFDLSGPVAVFEDGPLMELFFVGEGVWLTVATGDADSAPA